MGAADDAIAKFLQMFPPRADADEAAVAYGMIVTMLSDPEFAPYYEQLLGNLAGGLQLKDMAGVVRDLVGKAIAGFGGVAPPQFAPLLAL
jgi:hypothetical protein